MVNARLSIMSGSKTLGFEQQSEHIETDIAGANGRIFGSRALQSERSYYSGHSRTICAGARRLAFLGHACRDRPRNSDQLTDGAQESPLYARSWARGCPGSLFARPRARRSHGPALSPEATRPVPG